LFELSLSSNSEQVNTEKEIVLFGL